MNTSYGLRIWLCECGRVHVETEHFRQSYTPAEFLFRLRGEADRAGARVIPPNQPAYLDEACDTNTNSRAPHDLAAST
ncbi:MAG: hypothetical protein AB7U82_02400 [Blastocatellales bacterium]